VKYIIYWELDPKQDIASIAKLFNKLSQETRYPSPPGRILGWYITSSIPMWGVTLVEYNKDAGPEDIFRSLLAWIKEMPGVFKTHKIAPYLSVKEASQLALR